MVSISAVYAHKIQNYNLGQRLMSIKIADINLKAQTAISHSITQSPTGDEDCHGKLIEHVK
jgi:hypothetical protein